MSKTEEINIEFESYYGNKIFPLPKNKKVKPPADFNNRNFSRKLLIPHKGNFGLATNNIYFYDFDFKRNRKDEGTKEVFDYFKKHLPRLTKTLINKTPHGYHLGYVVKGKVYGNTGKKNAGYNRKGFIGSNKIKFGEYLQGLDTRADGGYVILPPSKVDGKEYKCIQNLPPLEITPEEYESIWKLFEETEIAKHTMRKGFVDILLGKINPQELKHKTGLDEHVYWKEMYHEAYSCCGLLPEDLFEGLAKFQKEGFKIEKTEKQLRNEKNRLYILNGKRLSKEKYNKYFPEYKNNSISKIDNLFETNKTDKEFFDLVDKINRDAEPSEIQNQIEKILLSIPTDKFLLKFSIKNKINKDLKIGKKIIDGIEKKALFEEERNKRMEVIKRNIEQKKIDDELRIEKGYKRIEIDFDFIELREEGLYFIKIIRSEFGDGENPEIILDGKFEILYITSLKNNQLFTFKFNGYTYNTKTITEIIEELKDYTYKGQKGRDALKRFLNTQVEEFELYKAKKILGFNDGWNLPQLEQEKKCLIISETEFQENIYNRTKNIIEDYSIEEKEQIRNDMKELLSIIQMKPINLFTTIGWSMVSPFKLAIIEHLDIFPHLYNYGVRKSGRSSLEKFFITYFFKVYPKALPSGILTNVAKFEDHMSESTFAHIIPEAHNSTEKTIIPIIKDMATGIPDFERKKNARKIDVQKPITAGICIDSNILIDDFKKAPIISRCIAQEHSIVMTNSEDWRISKNKLKKKKLFSFIYDITKDWNNKKVGKELDLMLNDIETDFELIGEDIYKKEYENPRIIPFLQIILLGIKLFEEAFNLNTEEIEFKSGLTFKKEDLLQHLETGRLLLPENDVEQFRMFLREAVNFEADWKHAETGIKYKGMNKPYINHELIKHNRRDGKAVYLFTMNNLHDFKKYTNKYFNNLKQLKLLLNEGLEDKTILTYKQVRHKEITYKAIQILCTWID